MFAAIFMTAIAAQTPQSTSVEAVSAFVTAVNCADEKAKNAPVNRNSPESIPREAAENCGQELDKAVPLMLAAVPDADQKIARDHLSAKMRMAAQSRLILRLEARDYQSFIDDKTDEAGFRYILCARVAISMKLDGVFLGEGWINDLRLKTPDEKIAALRAEAGRACPKSRAAYTPAPDKMSLNEIEDFALKGYLSVWK